jgi:hypothetical protein
MATDFRFPQSVGDYRIDVTRTIVPGAASVGKFGRRAGIASGAIEDIWCATAATLTYLTTPQRLLVESTDAGDSGGNVSVFITGLGVNFEAITEFVTLDGTNPVLTTKLYMRVNRLIISSAFETGNIGIVSVTSEITGDLQDLVPPGEGFSCSSHFTIPDGVEGVLVSVISGTQKNDEAELLMKLRIPALTGNGFFTGVNMPINASNASLRGVTLRLPPRTDLKFQAKAITNNIDITVAHSMYTVPI